MYRRGSGRSVLLVGVYVDDLIIVGVDAEEVEKFKAAMKQRFDMSDLRLLSFYLDIEVHQGAGGITLRQAHLGARRHGGLQPRPHADGGEAQAQPRQ